MFYLNVTYRGREWWLYTAMENNKRSAYLSKSATAAEAFRPSDAETFRYLMPKLFPGASAEKIECSSQKLIPENMRKVLNIA